MPYTVLIVDDQQTMLDLLKEVFTREAYHVLRATSAKEALSILEQKQADVIISDEKMPGMSGTEFLAIVKKKYPDIIRIILTGHANLDSAIRAINEGEVYRFFTKPCNMTDLTVTIRQALQQKDLMEQNRRLLETVRRQSLSIKNLEKRYPGIAKIKKDPGGAIIIDEE
ncbi:response regulator [Thermodesulfobacteriota bacterium]